MRIPESGKFFLAKSRILGFGIWNTAQGIQVPLTKTGIQYLESGIHGMESRIQDCLGSPYMGRSFTLYIYTIVYLVFCISQTLSGI